MYDTHRTLFRGKKIESTFPGPKYPFSGPNYPEKEYFWMGILSRGLVLLFRTFSGLRRLSRGFSYFLAQTRALCTLFRGDGPSLGAEETFSGGFGVFTTFPGQTSPQSWAPHDCTFNTGLCNKPPGQQLYLILYSPNISISY